MAARVDMCNGMPAVFTTTMVVKSQKAAGVDTTKQEKFEAEIVRWHLELV